MSQPSFRRSTAPDRRRSARLAVAGFLAAGSLLAFVVLVAPAGWGRPFFLACFVLAAAFGLLFLLAAVVPHRFVVEIRLTDEGFDYRVPLRRSRFVRFAEICRIEAVSRGDGDQGDEIPWRIHTRAGKIVIAEPVLILSGLHKALGLRLPLDREALSAAQRHEPRGLDLLVGRKFTLYERNQA